MPSPIYQYMIELNVSLPIRTGTYIVFINVSMREHHNLTTRYFDVAKCTILTPLSLLP